MFEGGVERTKDKVGAGNVGVFHWPMSCTFEIDVNAGVIDILM